MATRVDNALDGHKLRVGCVQVRVAMTRAGHRRSQHAKWAPTSVSPTDNCAPAWTRPALLPPPSARLSRRQMHLTTLILAWNVETMAVYVSVRRSPS